jgi:hypothetical protein
VDREGAEPRSGSPPTLRRASGRVARVDCVEDLSSAPIASANIASPIGRRVASRKMRRMVVLLWFTGVLLSARAAAQPTGDAIPGDGGGDAAATAGVSATTSGDEAPPGPLRTAANASELPTAAAEERPWDAPTQRYGLQILAIDAASIAAGIGMQNGEVFLAGWMFGAPVVHLAHGNGLRALGSLALHLGLPLTGGLVGAVASCGSSDGAFCGLGGFVIGGGLGMIAATSIDGALARETAPVPSRPVARFIPQLQIGTGHVTVGIVGSL